MTSIVELFPKARRLVFDLQTQMQYVERGHASPDEVRLRLEELERQLKVLSGFAGQERPAQRENWRRKLRELASERDFLRDQLERHDLGRRKMGQEAQEREELLARRRTVRSPSTVSPQPTSPTVRATSTLQHDLQDEWALAPGPSQFVFDKTFLNVKYILF
ncbi:unnamed protein product [Choristocarpus tenellus]